MQIFKNLFYSSFFLLFSTLSIAAPDDKGQGPALNAVGNSDIAAEIVVNGEKLHVEGTSSFHLSASEEELRNGEATLNALNVVFNGVRQNALNYGGGQDNRTGNLTFVVNGAQSVKYDAKRGTLVGEVAGLIGANYMGDYANPLSDSKEGDHSEAPRQDASLFLEIQLDEPFDLDESEKPKYSKAEAKFDFFAEDDQRMSAYELEISVYPVYELEYAYYPWPIFEVAKKLCVQPVRLSRLVWNWPLLSWDYTGAGLAFGQPEANKQWAKADVIFNWRSWKTVYSPAFFNFSTSEVYDLMDTVDDDDCVEVFFVEGDDDMHNSWGGGASAWGGEAYTKIVSSDGNAAVGIDRVHLAHELGHSMDLPHPNYYNSASTNTLMCPSGFANDNPARNSQENKDNISNPLFTFSLKVISAGPDCTDSADCGSCP